MFSGGEHDAQAEAQIQRSFQCVAGELSGSCPLGKCEAPTRFVKDFGSPIERDAAAISPPEAQVLPEVVVPSSKHRQRTTPSEQTAFFQPATSKQSKIEVNEVYANGRSRELREVSANRPSSCVSALNHEPIVEGSNRVVGSISLDIKRVGEDMAATSETFRTPGRRFSASTIDSFGSEDKLESAQEEVHFSTLSNRNIGYSNDPRISLTASSSRGDVPISGENCPSPQKNGNDRNQESEPFHISYLSATHPIVKAPKNKEQEIRDEEQENKKKQQSRRKKKQMAKAVGKRRASNSPLYDFKAKRTKLDDQHTVASSTNLQRTFENLDSVGTPFAIEGIEGLVKRYKHLDSDLPPGKEWFYAWQEITAILRTPSHYKYIALRTGFSMELHTNFKVFRLQGPFANKSTGKHVITKKAVLHVIDDPFFFEKAIPALEDLCRRNGLALPKYRCLRKANDTYTCDVHFGSEVAIFGEAEEYYATKKEATEDTAKKAMNALHREGLLLVVSTVNNKQSAVFDSSTEPDKQHNPQGSLGSIIQSGRRVSARLKDTTNGAARKGRSRQTGNKVGASGYIGADKGITVQALAASPRSSFKVPRQRTRTGLARLLKGIREPRQRVNAMCGYLSILRPTYVVRQRPSGKQWSARFSLNQSLIGEGDSTVPMHKSISGANGPEDCARMVELMLFEKIYNGEIHLDDGDATFPDPAMDLERNSKYFARLSPRAKRCLESDESLTLEEISQRHDGPNELLLPSANSVPLGVAKRPVFQSCGLNQGITHSTEDYFPPASMSLPDTDDQEHGRARSDVLSGVQAKPLRQSVTAPIATARENIKSFSKQPMPESTSSLHVEDTARRFLAEEAIESDEQPQLLLPSGEHRYVSPPPFLDTPICPVMIGPALVKAEPVQSDEEDDEVIFLGERTIKEKVAIVPRGDCFEVNVIT